MCFLKVSYRKDQIFNVGTNLLFFEIKEYVFQFAHAEKQKRNKSFYGAAAAWHGKVFCHVVVLVFQ